MKGIKLGEAYLDLVEINFNDFNKRYEIVFTSDEKGLALFERGYGEYDVLSFKSTNDFYDFQERCCYRLPAINKVIFNRPATIVLWEDDTKTVVKCNNEPFDREKGLAMAVAKKAMGNKSNFNNKFKKWVDYDSEPATVVIPENVLKQLKAFEEELEERQRQQ